MSDNEVKRYTVNGYVYLHTPIGNFIPTENVDRSEFILASDFDSYRERAKAELRLVADQRDYAIKSNAANYDLLQAALGRAEAAEKVLGDLHEWFSYFEPNDSDTANDVSRFLERIAALATNAVSAKEEKPNGSKD